MQTAKSIFIGGTASHVGKSWMATAICAYLRRRGLRVAPFKAQNMSNNSYPCPSGGEIGRAQVAQAEACGLEPSPDMNPILLKPTRDTSSQVVLHGKVWRDLTAKEYYEHYDFLQSQVLDAYDRLSARHEVIVIEGAGSVAELNLRDRDLVNFGLALKLDAPTLLVSDIDRGGVFGALFGTMSLLEPEERHLVRAFAVNRFRGDPSLFTAGAALLEAKLCRPCLGVFPFDPNIHIDEEDAVSIDSRPSKQESAIAVIHLPHISNFTDFRRLPAFDWLTRPPNRDYRIIFIPGTKNTTGDLQWLRTTGLADWILEQHASGATVVGICGGYQMLGKQISDPDLVEGVAREVRGLGLLPVRTVMRREKVTHRVRVRLPNGVSFYAYEIHMGETDVEPGVDHFAENEGVVANHCIGTYLHGAFENEDVLRTTLGIEPKPVRSRAEQYESLASWFAHSADIPLFEERFL
ncbi:MAG TPA: cobyric acid synthase [Bryobacteraceae bacterium]|nr:cobyric acid synthase [Bryobacteraceae bacterium]